jgi:predicted ATPase
MNKEGVIRTYIEMEKKDLETKSLRHPNWWDSPEGKKYRLEASQRSEKWWSSPEGMTHRKKMEEFWRDRGADASSKRKTKYWWKVKAYAKQHGLTVPEAQSQLRDRTLKQRKYRLRYKSVMEERGLIMNWIRLTKENDALICSARKRLDTTKHVIVNAAIRFFLLNDADIPNGDRLAGSSRERWHPDNTRRKHGDGQPTL